MEDQNLIQIQLIGASMAGTSVLAMASERFVTMLFVAGMIIMGLGLFMSYTS